MAARKIALRIVIAPDSYKGSASAVLVAKAMRRGVLRVFPTADVRCLPIADGGEGTVEVLVSASAGQYRKTIVHGPLGRPVEATWGILGDGRTAVIEMAAASGLTLLAGAQRNPRKTTSFGTGQLIRAALDAGLRDIIIGLGGSATNDGGAGMAQALGARFLTANGDEIADGGAALATLDRIDLTGLDPRLMDTTITVACDVDNPLCGARGASAIFGPQKGADATAVAELDAALAHYAACACRATGRDVAERPGAGAAGGLGAGLLFFTPAELKPGVEIVLEALDFSRLVKDADFVITGEGRTDFQTAFGKAPVGVARAAAKYDVPVFCLSGALGPGADDVLAHGIAAVLSICDVPMTLSEAMASAEILIENAAVRLCRIIAATRNCA